jgi:hypothetical protein
MTQEKTIIWAELDLASLIPPEVLDAISQTGTLAETLKTLSDAVTAVLDVLAGIIVGSVDLMAAALQALISALDALIEFFVATSVGITWLIPYEYKTAPTCAEFLRTISASFDDTNDIYRPISNSPDTHYLMWFGIASGPTIADVQSKINALMALLKQPILTPETDGFFINDYLGEPPVWPPINNTDVSRAPDWSSIKLGEFGPFAAVVNGLLSIRSILVMPANEVEQLRARIALIQKRVADILMIVDEIIAVQKLVEDFTNAATNLVSLVIYGQGNSTQQKVAILEAINEPNYPYKYAGNFEKCGGIVLHFQSANSGAIEVLKKLFNVKEVITTARAEVATLTDSISDKVDAATENIDNVQDLIKESW